jgi:Rad3-related DNA helicase
MIGLWHHQHSTVVRYARRDPEPSITISLIAPQVLTSKLSTDYHSAMVFGDTVYPHDTFVRLMGLTLNKVNNRTYLDRSHMKDLTVAAFTDVDTSMRLRLDQRQDDQYPVIAATLARLAKRAPGRTMAVFPSYNFLERTMEALRFSHPVRFVAESRGMRKEERDRLLTEVSASEDVLVLAVQNGTLVRAFESGAYRASTAVVVGLQFNPPTVESGQMKLFFHENYGSASGETISRILPAAQKAMRIVNAQMYSEGKGRLVVLMDRRYHDRRNLEALPPFWDIKFISNPETLQLERLVSE